jgi:6-phosphogluconolactonase (cycloisomerase 2 family)
MTVGGSANVAGAAFGYGTASATTPATWPASSSGGGATAVAVDGTGALAFATTVLGFNGALSTFTIDPSSGAFSASPIDARSFSSTSTYQIAPDPHGRFVYVRLGNGKIASYAVDAGGHLTDLLAVGAGSAGAGITVDPSGQYVYAADSSAGKVHVFKVDRTTGQLSPITGSPFGVGMTPGAVAATAICK